MVRIFHMFALLQNTISPFLFTDLPQVMVAMMLLLHFLASSLLHEAENSSSYSRDRPPGDYPSLQCQRILTALFLSEAVFSA